MAKMIVQLRTQLDQAIAKIKTMPKEKLIAYGAIGFGLFLILVAIILW